MRFYIGGRCHNVTDIIHNRHDEQQWLSYHRCLGVFHLQQSSRGIKRGDGSIVAIRKGLDRSIGASLIAGGAKKNKSTLNNQKKPHFFSGSKDKYYFRLDFVIFTRKNEGEGNESRNADVREPHSSQDLRSKPSFFSMPS